MSKHDPEEDTSLAHYKGLYYQRGDKAQLIHAVAYCIRHNIPVPDWLRQAFVDASDAAYAYKIRSWQEVFGLPVAKGTRLAKERRNMEIQRLIFHSVQELHKGGKAIDNELFRAVGKKHHVSGAVARDLYYAEVKEFK